jgi:hypothetical protein
VTPADANASAAASAAAASSQPSALTRLPIFPAAAAQPGGSAASGSGSGPVALASFDGLSSSDMAYIKENWHSGGRGRAENALYHTRKHGNGRNPIDFTRAAIKLRDAHDVGSTPVVPAQGKLKPYHEITDGRATGRYTTSRGHRIFNFRDS